MHVGLGEVRKGKENQITPSEGHKGTCGSESLSPADVALPLAPIPVKPRDKVVAEPSPQPNRRRKTERTPKKKKKKRSIREEIEKEKEKEREREKGMAESRDLAFKLFGKTIPLQPTGESPPVSGGSEESGGKEEKVLLTGL